jgi:hypothetical protein
MIEDLDNNKWEILGVEIYAPNLITAIKRFLARNDTSAIGRDLIERKLKEMK